MDLGKFVWLLQNRALFFARSDNLGDPYEGHYTRAMAELGEGKFIEAIQPPSPGAEEGMRARYRKYLEWIAERKLRIFVNSWHMNEAESAAMWRLYTTLNEAICITSTFEKLAAELPDDAFFGMVTYIDYNEHFIKMDNALNYIAHKRSSYAHEREVRAVIYAEDDNISAKYSQLNDGMVVGIELNRVVESVYVSPSSSPMMREIVTNLLTTYGLAVPVRQSEVNAPPPY
jgi:hypothetical protein